MLAKKINKYLVSINNIEDINTFKKVGITTFSFALEKYSIGYYTYYDVDTINSINETKYVIINRLLNTTDVDTLKEILPKLNVDGYIFEDISLINIFKELNIQGKKILFINHFNCNSLSINCWLEYVDSVIVSNELTYEEYSEITKKVNKPIVINIFGYNQIMYSRRYLLSNFYKKYNEDIKYTNHIKDQNSDISFNIKEEDKGTIIYSNRIYDGRRLLDLDNILYYYLNTSFIDTNTVIDFINGLEIDSDNGFLDKKTIYKLKERV